MDYSSKGLTYQKPSLLPVPSSKVPTTRLTYTRVPTPRPPLPVKPKSTGQNFSRCSSSTEKNNNQIKVLAPSRDFNIEQERHTKEHAKEIAGSRSSRCRGEELLYMSTMYSVQASLQSSSLVRGRPISREAQASAAAVFFARATAKLSLGSSPHRKKRLTGDGDGFSQALSKYPPPIPPPLLRRLGSKEISGLGKVKVILKVAGCASDADTSLLHVDSRKRQVTLFDPATCGAASLAPEERRLGVAAPKMFAFDAIFTEQDPKGELCATGLTDVIHAVINGTDGCLFSFGHSKLGKSNTMIGQPKADQLGVIPCAISWLFKCIAEQKQKTGARFSVRVSAVEVAGPSYMLKDLLSQHASECEQSPGIYLCEGALQNYCELRAPTPEKAGFFFDNALTVRSSEQSHLFYTLHVYQYSVAGKGGVAGGRSRLHLIDLGGCERSKGTGLPLSGIGNVLLAIFNGQKHIPHREHKLSQQLKECLGSLTCHAAMIAHVSPEESCYTDTLTTVHLASRIHRMRRKRFKFPANGGAIAGEEGCRLTGSSDIDPSSSEQSADTVIYVGPTDETDGEHPPVYLPSLNSGDNRCAMSKALRGSLVDQKIKSVSRSVPASPQRSAPEEKPTQRKATKPNSTRSSPVRQAKTSREEKWIDGPRILKSKVTEGRNIHLGREKKETWVDGPKLSNGHNYGFMDSHKKNMIRKWVENQSMHVGKSRHHKEQFRSTDEARGRASGQEDEGSSNQTTHLLPVNKVVPLEKLECSGVDQEYDEDMEVEIIEVEEPAEPVPMQDCCLQVTEEDIALCMGEVENPLPEVDQEEHPLRILSQENLTVVSTFTDSLSIVNDLERLFPRNSTLVGGGNIWEKTKANNADILAKKMAQYEQLTALHDLYNAKRIVNEMKPVSRCQSLMFSEFISGTANDFDVNSIASEPAYFPGESKLCDNCKVNLEVKEEANMAWAKQDTRFHSFRKMTSISSLRHPDGASNPNLRDMCNREPGNGAEMNMGKDEDDDISVPPPLNSSMYTITRETFDGAKLKNGGCELTNSFDHTINKAQYCKADVERLEKGWNDTQKCIRRDIGQEQKVLKAEITATRHRIFSPLYSCFSGNGGLFEKRNQFQATSSSKTPNKSQAV
ncbi:kinesin-like protein CG14535 isoform X1 [Cimex lectularius]|uniref:Kinesin motor domain-containing protein n=2 Tax=Cimex lectularius TaxID=79782 RepID=A0A8I6S9Q3_CIMLE|nr:kinesin-like protein CG14535 isoform X1 [Cimex lectularius]